MDQLGTTNFPDFAGLKPHVGTETVCLVISQRLVLVAFFRLALWRIADQQILVKRVGEA